MNGVRHRCRPGNSPGRPWHLGGRFDAAQVAGEAAHRGHPVRPHAFRHTAAMNLLHAGVDTTVIALWLGHADVRSTNAYLHADLAIKERALARVTPITAAPGRYRPVTPD
jgi:integrase